MACHAMNRSRLYQQTSVTCNNDKIDIIYCDNCQPGGLGYTSTNSYKLLLLEVTDGQVVKAGVSVT